MKILVVGSEGMVGRPLVRHLRACGHEVLRADIRQTFEPDYTMADVNVPLDLLPAFDWGPEVVYLLSAMVSRVTCEAAASLAVTTNLAGVNNVAQLCKRGSARLVYFSTSEVYGPEAEVMEEDTTPCRPNNRYGLTKLLGEEMIKYEGDYHNLDFAIVRPFMMYSEDEPPTPHRSAMIRFVSDLAAGRTIEVYRGAARGWLHVDDAVRAFEQVLHIDGGWTINVGHPDVRPIEDLAGMIRSILGVSPGLVHVLDLPSQMTLVKRPDLHRQKALLGFDPTISLEVGVRRVCRRFGNG